MVQHSTRHSESVLITDARSGASRDQAQRQKRYALTMGFRTACFLAMIFVPGVFRWILLGLAVLLPYVAVIFANQANQRSDAGGPVHGVPAEPMPELTTGQYETISEELNEDGSWESDRSRRPDPDANQDDTHRAA